MLFKYNMVESIGLANEAKGVKVSSFTINWAL